MHAEDIQCQTESLIRFSLLVVCLNFPFLKKLEEYSQLLLSQRILTLRTTFKFRGSSEADRSKELSKIKWKITKINIGEVTPIHYLLFNEQYGGGNICHPSSPK